MAGYVSSAAEDPPEARTECRCCGEALCPECGDCPRRDPLWACRAAPCMCPLFVRRQALLCDRWQEALDEAEDGAIDDAKVRELEQ